MTEADVEDLFAPMVPVTLRRMFGGMGVFHEGRMFALVAYGELYLKTDGESVAAFEAAGSVPFSYTSGTRTVVTSYWRLPDDAFEDEATRAAFTGRALAASERAAEKKAPRARKATGAAKPAGAPKPAGARRRAKKET
ncbi:TfoX/Sxy family protein [Acuticoccus kandeliae]|uniref:TfoX/Sxy family protein n=1 Tax=Acuticoccus kandeliae TaxID=2073160 RepID=UPI000D3E56E1|nr:TfoX/Sxy family protein [Acuticoccus kandeliae]